MPDNDLTTIELTVIALSRSDPVSSLEPRRNLFFRLFGSQTHLPLANSRLEALRRYAMLLRLQGYRIAEAEHERIRSAGYDEQQIDAIDRLVAPSLHDNRVPLSAIAPPPPRPETIATDQPNARESEQEVSPSPPVSTAFRGPKFARLFMHYLPDPCPRFIAIVAILSFLFASSSALAQEKDHIIIGVGAVYAPTYQGADDYRVMPLPAIDVRWGPFFANFGDGIGVNAIDTEFITAGASVTFMPGYRSKDAPDGIGKLTAGAGGRVFVNLKAAGFIASIGATKGFAGGTKGIIADASLSYPVMVSPRFMLIPTIGATWADKKHNDRYFGVDAAQSLASGLSQFRPGGGLKDASATLSAQYRLTDRISLGVTGGATTLLGKVQDSPIVFHKTQPFGFLSLSYRFGS